VITASLFPAIINAKKKNENLYYLRFQRLYDFMVFMAIAIALPMTFLGYWIVELLYGAQYNQAESVLVIHIWASVFVFLGVAGSRWFIIENLQMLTLQKTFYGMITNIILNFILIPKYGIQGAAFATLVSQATSAYVTDFFYIKTRKVFYMKSKSIFFINILKKIN